MEEFLICEDCGRSDSTVEESFCPFAEEIYGEEIDVVLCIDCYNERADDI